jgi:AcrR family transcriptional regulator
MDPRVERSRALVLRAALAELAEVGYGAFTIDSVATRSGVARSTIYRHWDGRLDLIAEALETLNQQPGPPSAEVAGASPRERVRTLVRHLAEAMRDSTLSACIPALIDAAERDPDVRAFHHRYSARRRRALTEAIAAGVAAGDFAAGIDPDLAALALAGAVIYRRTMTGRPFPPDQVGELVALVLPPHTRR